jgi:rhodanese-related sulfurtransferase
LRKAGYELAIAVAGGMTAWREAGLPVDKKST